MTRVPRLAAAALSAVAMSALVAACASSPMASSAPPKLSDAAVCAKWEEQTQWLTYLNDPSPAQIAQLDAYIAQDAREAADPALAAALRGERNIGEIIAAGADPVDAQAGVSSICANYP